MKFKDIRHKLTVAASGLLLASAVYAAGAVNSGDPTLSALEIRVDGKNLVNFDKNTTTYNIELEDASMMTLSAAPTASDATVTITVNGRAYDNHSLSSLDGGDNTIVYNVKSGSQSRSYTVNIKTPQVTRGRHFTWKNATVYFVLTDRFYNGDSSNDKSYHRQRPQGNVPDYATFHGGDIKGLTEKLDYLDKLGVDAIWISAPYEQMHGWTGGKDDAFPHYAFHGYYALDWTYMDRNMGTVDEFRTFVTEAHRRGIRVVMDIVLNHTGYCTLDDALDYDFGNFNGTPTAGWLPSGKYTMWSTDNAVSFNTEQQGKWGNWWGPWVRAFGDCSWASSVGYVTAGGDNYTMSLAGLPDVVTERTSAVSIPPFLKQKWAQENSGDYLKYRLPNLDQWRVDSKGAPADYIINWLAGWVEEFGIDGFRCDTAKHVELNRWNQLKQACRTALGNWRSSARADEYAKGWTDEFWMTGEAFGWDHGDTGYFTQGGFDSMINFAFNSSEGSSGRTPTTEDWRYYANYCNGSNGHQVLNYVSSHDTGLHRPGNQKTVATMLLLCPGGAQIYYGDETSRGMMSGCPDASMATRSDFNWSAVDSDDNKHWQKIGQFRRRNPAVGAGTQTELGNDTYARTYSEGDYTNSVVIRLNTTAGQTYTVSVGSAFAEGAKVMDGYNVANTATVSGGKVTMTASGPVMLIEPYGTITDEEIVIPPVPQKPTVTANPGNGTVFDNSVTVTLSATQGAQIRYSTTSAAGASSTVYTTPLTFTETTTLSTYVSNENGSSVQTFTYTKRGGGDDDDDDDKDECYVYFENTKGWNVKVWAWNDNENCNENGTWPGDPMIEKDGKLYWAAPAGKVPTKIIFSNNGGDKAGNGDLDFVNGATYKPDGSYGNTPDVPLPAGSRTIHFKGGWSAVPYVYVYSGSGDSAIKHAGAWPGTQMTAEGSGWYKYDLPDAATTSSMVIFNTGNGGADRYPADGEPGVALNFQGNEGWYTLSTHSWSSSNPDGPQKPTVTISPNGGRVKGSATITVSVSSDATSVSGTFGSRALSLSAGTNSVSVSDYLTSDGATANMSVTATNAVGSTTANLSFTRDDTEVVYTLTGDHRELSIYQIMVGSFQHGDGGASGYSQMWGPEGHRKNGNIRGIINALDYIKDLGMNAIWLTPVFDSSNGGNGDERLKATGYFANDYFKIDPHFGTDAEFRELVDKAHEKGLYIILDGVFGHHSNATGASPKGNYIDNRTATNVRNADAGNIAYPGSLEYFKEVVRYWMDGYGVDGWRLDQCYQVYQGGHNYWYELRQEVEAVARERKNRGETWGTLGFMVGEDWTTASGITVTQQDGLKSVMDFDGQTNLVNLGYGVGSIEWFLKTDAAGRGYSGSDVIPTVFLSNHDTSRVGDAVSSVEGLMTRHAAVACYSGPTCTYYGDEIGDKSGNGASDNKARTSGRISGFNADEQRLHDYVAKVFKARAANPALWRGSVSTRKDSESNCQVVEITKTDAQSGNKVVVIFSQKDTNWSIAGTGEDLINGGTVSGSVSVKAWVPVFIKMN